MEKLQIIWEPSKTRYLHKRLFEMTFPDLAKASMCVSLKFGRSGRPGVSDFLSVWYLAV
mgnify:CR=1 FL=1